MLAALCALLALACATSALGRRQLKIFPESEMESMGTAAFAQLVGSTPASTDAVVNAYVTCVARAVTGALTGADAGRSWEVRVFADDTPNAFALPGGKIGVHTGLLPVTENQDQLAVVIGHEVSHVLAGHANERMSTEFAAQSALGLLQAATDAGNPLHGQVLGALGVGAQVGVLLPYGRAHEREADLLGLDLMARAGFDPRQSILLWRNMAAAGGAEPVEFLSTHPSHDSRIRELSERLVIALPLYEQARASGRRPRCS